MVSIFVSQGRRLDDEEADLGMPDASEAQNLERHVDRCAMRYRMFTRRMSLQGKSIRRIELIAYGVAIWLLATSTWAQQAFRVLFHL